MLWPVVKPPNSSMYWLDEIHKIFYTKLFDGRDFDDCFPTEFNAVLTASSKTKGCFNSVYEDYHLLTDAHKASFRQVYEQQVNLVDAYSDTLIVLLKPNIKRPNTTEHKELWGSCKKLGECLYVNTLGLRCFTDALSTRFNTLLLADMSSHYQEFKRLNSGICSFCGLLPLAAEVLIDPTDEHEIQLRASYDHYLPKAKYPFLAVDFDGLIPCCDTCNEDFKKHEDVLEIEEKRSLAFTPYSQDQVRLIADYSRSDGDFYQMLVKIEETGCVLELKGKTWDKVFKVTGRANKLFKDCFSEEWLAPLLVDVDNVEEAKRKLLRESIKFIARRTFSKEAYYKELIFRYLSNSADEVVENLITTVQAIYAPRVGLL